MMERQNKDVKKKIMFAVEADANFISYNIIIILIAFNCKNNSRYFKDFNKLAFLISVVQKEQYKKALLEILDDNSSDSTYNYETILELYYTSRLIKRNISGVIFALDRKNIIELKKTKKTIDLTLIDNHIIDKFVSSQKFKDDIEFYIYIGRKIKRFTVKNEETIDDIIFKDLKEIRWEDYF